MTALRNSQKMTQKKETELINLKFKPDWDETKKRYERWWAHELLRNVEAWSVDRS